MRKYLLGAAFILFLLAACHIGWLYGQEIGRQLRPPAEAETI